ncbi:MAG: hypothetical protein SGARI_003860, partial [Bacillariaceae sp.]
DSSGKDNNNISKQAAGTIKFVVIDQDGNERRMTKAEKKAKKQEIALQKKLDKQRARHEREMAAAVGSGGDNGDEVAATADDAETPAASVAPEASGTSQDNDITTTLTTTSPSSAYHQMPLNEAVMEQELEEIREENRKLAPVVLSPSMAMQFRDKVVVQTSSFTPSNDDDDDDHNHTAATIVYSHNKSQEWAVLLKEKRILPAEEYRSKEDLRPLAYKLHPEPWQRLRPSLEETPLATKKRRRDATCSGDKNSKAGAEAVKPIQIPKSCDWAAMTCRPPCAAAALPLSSKSSPLLSHDDMLSIVFEYIYRETSYYVSCGAKFGSDFLIYDGPREERHAFAGLRVLSPQFSPKSDDETGGVLPLPTAFSLTSYVRCLNTAGKLALVATVVPEENHRYQVLLIDVALEKVLDAPTHKRKRKGGSNQQKRKDITKNLAKT